MDSANANSRWKALPSNPSPYRSSPLRDAQHSNSSNTTIHSSVQQNSTTSVDACSNRGSPPHQVGSHQATQPSNVAPAPSGRSQDHSPSPPEKQEAKDHFTIRRWPTEPRKLKEKSFFSHLYSAADVITAVLPIIFIVLCILAARLNGTSKENNSLGRGVESAMRLGPTIFPILFAAVAGRTMKAAAHFCAERGAKLGHLELLMASQTVWGTVESQFLMQHLTHIGVFLILLWGMSPLGGQASLRLLDVGVSSRFNETEVRYFDTGPVSITMNTFYSDAGVSSYSAMNSLYDASLLAPQDVKVGDQDLWGNLKIPRIEFLEAESAIDRGGWINHSIRDKRPEDYSSLVGIPIVGVSDNPSSFNVEASYMSVNCPPMRKFMMDQNRWRRGLGYLWANHSHYRLGPNPFSVTPPNSLMATGDIPASFFLDTSTVLDDTSRLRAEYGEQLTLAQSQDPSLNLSRNLVFGSRLPYPPRYSAKHPDTPLGITNCTLTQTHVEAKVNCSASTNCRVTKMRRSLTDTRPAQLSPLDVLPIAITFLNSFQTASWTQNGYSSSPTEIFMKDTSISPYEPGRASSETFIDLSTLPPDVLSARLSLVLNTYYQLSLAPFEFAGSLSSNLSLYGPRDLTVNITHFWKVYPNLSNVPMISRSDIAVVRIDSSIYVCSWPWISLLIASSAILLLTGVVGLVLKYRGHAPDMLGYVSSMTYHNPYITLPAGGGPLDGMERARTLKDVKVKIADVRGSEKYGHVALVSIDEIAGEPNNSSSWNIRKLERSRSYF